MVLNKMCRRFKSKMKRFGVVRVETFVWKPGWHYVLKMGFLLKASYQETALGLGKEPGKRRTKVDCGGGKLGLKEIISQIKMVRHKVKNAIRKETLMFSNKKYHYELAGEVVKKESRYLDIDISSLGAKNMLIASFSKLGVLMKTSVYISVLEEARNGALAIALAQPIVLKFEKQYVDFYYVTIIEQKALTRSVCRVQSIHRNKGRTSYPKEIRVLSYRYVQFSAHVISFVQTTIRVRPLEVVVAKVLKGKYHVVWDMIGIQLQGEFASVFVRYDLVVGLSIITATWTKKKLKYSSSNGVANCHDICSYEVGSCEKKIVLVGSLELQSKAQKFSQFPFDTFD
ncbi:hypothetical protein Hanom_Chr16g01447631 [Helianthus anomalus]